MDAREDRPLRRPRRRLRGAAAVLLLAASLAGAAAQRNGRPALADDVEKRFDGRFLLATDGSGAYAIYQRVEADLASPREVVCLMRECYVAIASATEQALEAATREPGMRRRIVALFAAARDDYARVLASPRDARAAAETAWLDRAARIGPCIAERRCGED